MKLEPTPQGFLRDGQPHLIISGAVHYNRVHPQQWADRLAKLAAMGCNTVENYVPWNYHEQRRGEFDFSQGRDLERFLELAAEQGLDAIVRPGPYICAEWEAGGFPGWLLADTNLKLRCMEPGYLSEVDRWFDELIPRIAAHQTSRGGNVVMVQVENEYGSFGDDTAYLEHLRDGLIARGIDELLVTSDGPSPDWLSGGTVEGALATVNFGSRAAEVIEMARTELPDQPLMCMEFWNGWFDHWGEEHHTRSAEDAARELDTMLAAGMSVNFYVAHGGTNFGLWNGANHGDPFTDAGLQPTVTSYDYDAPISEDGRLSKKFGLFRDVIAKYAPIPQVEVSEPTFVEPQPVELRWTPLVGSELAEPEFTHCAAPPSFERFGLERGWLHLRRTTRVPEVSQELRLLGLHDRAWVHVDGRLVGVADRNEQPTHVDLNAAGPLEPGSEVQLDIWVENSGRINFGPQLHDLKGILRGVWLGTRYLNDWQVAGLPLEELGDRVAELAARGPELDPERPGAALGVGTFEADASRDAHLDVSGLGHAVVWVNGFCLGRANAVGPQTTLYVPAPVVRPGSNRVSVLDAEPVRGGRVAIVDRAAL